MGKQISYSISYIFYVNTVLLNVLIINSKAEIPTGYLSGRNYTWTSARVSCKMIGLFDHIQVPDTERQLAWVDAYAKYTPWFEYTDCFYVRPKFIDKYKRVTYGNQLQQCLNYCEDYNYIGLQQTHCSCLSLSETTGTTVISACNKKEICQGDKYAYCAHCPNDTTSLNCFIVYKKGNISGIFNTGNCLSVSSNQRSTNYFQASPCGTMLEPFCTGFHTTYGQKYNWTSSFNQCGQNELSTYASYKRSQRSKVGNFCLANIRRPIIYHSSNSDPKYCIAVIIRKSDHQVYRYVRLCSEELPAVCAITDVPSADTNIVPIALIIVAVLLVAIFIAVIVLYKRRTSLRSGNQPNIVQINEVTYAQVNKPTKEKTPANAVEPTRNNTTDDTYDHMEHHRLSQNQIQTESNYDTMQSVGNGELENNYDVKSGTDRPRQIVVDDTAEYSHVEAEIKETKDAAT